MVFMITGGMRGAYRVLVGKPDVKGQLGGPRRRWYRNDLQNVGWERGM